MGRLWGHFGPSLAIFGSLGASLGPLGGPLGSPEEDIEEVYTFVYRLYTYAADPAGKTQIIFGYICVICSQIRHRDKGGREASVQRC